MLDKFNLSIISMTDLGYCNGVFKIVFFLLFLSLFFPTVLRDILHIDYPKLMSGKVFFCDRPSKEKVKIFWHFPNDSESWYNYYFHIWWVVYPSLIHQNSIDFRFYWYFVLNNLAFTLVLMTQNVINNKSSIHQHLPPEHAFQRKFKGKQRKRGQKQCYIWYCTNYPIIFHKMCTPWK